MYNSGFNGRCEPQVYNSIMWDNHAKGATGSIYTNIFNDHAGVTMTHSLLQGSGGSADWTFDDDYFNGGVNIDADPKFIDPVKPGSIPTSSGNLRLNSNSPAIDAGDNQ